MIICKKRYLKFSFRFATLFSPSSRKYISNLHRISRIFGPFPSQNRIFRSRPSTSVGRIHKVMRKTRETTTTTTPRNKSNNIRPSRSFLVPSKTAPATMNEFVRNLINFNLFLGNFSPAEGHLRARTCPSPPQPSRPMVRSCC